MRFSCERCGRRFATREPPVPGRVYRTTCRCGNDVVLLVHAPTAPAVHGTPPATTLAAAVPAFTGAGASAAGPVDRADAPPARRAPRGARSRALGLGLAVSVGAAGGALLTTAAASFAVRSTPPPAAAAPCAEPVGAAARVDTQPAAPDPEPASLARVEEPAPAPAPAARPASTKVVRRRPAASTPRRPEPRGSPTPPRPEAGGGRAGPERVDAGRSDAQRVEAAAGPLAPEPLEVDPGSLVPEALDPAPGPVAPDAAAGPSAADPARAVLEAEERGPPATAPADDADAAPPRVER